MSNLPETEIPQTVVAAVMTAAGLEGLQPHELIGRQFSFGGVVSDSDNDQLAILLWGKIEGVAIEGANDPTLRLWVSTPMFFSERLTDLCFAQRLSWRATLTSAYSNTLGEEPGTFILLS